MKILLSIICSATMLSALYKMLFYDAAHFREEATGWWTRVGGPFQTGFTGLRFAAWLVLGVGGGVFAGIALFSLLDL
jgi:hypothetical protein